MCVLPLSAQVKVGVEGGMNLSHYLVSGSDGYKAEQVGGMKPGFQLGVTVDYEIGKHWMLTVSYTHLDVYKRQGFPAAICQNTIVL